MLSVIACPHCERLIETNQPDGQCVPCPYCAAGFVIRPEFRVRRSNIGNVVARICIPLGYVLFVALPLALTIWYFTRKGEPPAPNEVAVEPAGRDERKPAPRPVPRPRKEKIVNKDTEPEPEPPVDLAPTAEVEPAPPPREVFVAPEPHESFWKIPTGDYSSKWQTVGAVDLRVAGLAVTKVPIVDAKEWIGESATPLLVILIEARANAAGKPRALTSWTDGSDHYAAIFPENGKDLAPAVLPRGTKPNTGLAYKQPLPEDGTPVRDVLLFAVPAAHAGELSLRLEAKRCGETGDVWFKIPAAAVKK